MMFMLLFWSSGKHAEILALEGCDLGILVVQGALGIVQLFLEKVSCALGIRGRARRFVLVNRDVISEQTCCAVWGSLAVKAIVNPGSPLERAISDWTGSIFRVLGSRIRSIAGIHREVLIREEIVFLDDGLNAGPAEDLLRHDGKTAVEILRRHRLDKIRRAPSAGR